MLRDLLESDATLLGQRPGQVILADKGYRSAEFETFLTEHGATLIRPAMAGERHGGRTWGGVVARVLQRLVALTAVIWHNGQLGRHPVRSLLAYEH